MLQEACHIKNKVVFIFRQIQCLHLMYSEVVWVLISSGTQVQPQIILDPDYLPDYFSVHYDYDSTKKNKIYWTISPVYERNSYYRITKQTRNI